MNRPHHQAGFAFSLLVCATIPPFIAAIHHWQKDWEMILRLWNMSFVSKLPILPFHPLLAHSPAYIQFLLGFAPLFRPVVPWPSS